MRLAQRRLRPPDHRFELTGCGKEGYFGNGLTDVLFQGNHIHHNNVSLGYDPQSEAGGGKVMASQDIRFVDNEVDHNGGPGIWFDNGVSDVTVRGNRSHDNHESGIMFEISSGASITDNAVWNNGFGHAAWGFGAGHPHQLVRRREDLRQYGRLERARHQRHQPIARALAAHRQRHQRQRRSCRRAARS